METICDYNCEELNLLGAFFSLTTLCTIRIVHIPWFGDSGVSHLRRCAFARDYFLATAQRRNEKQV
jgi:hypothetical protein